MRPPSTSTEPIPPQNPEADDTADIDDTPSDGVGPGNNGWQQVELAWVS
jgi:hypothetical protein